VLGEVAVVPVDGVKFALEEGALAVDVVEFDEPPAPEGAEPLPVPPSSHTQSVYTCHGSPCTAIQYTVSRLALAHLPSRGIFAGILEYVVWQS
jgi:hypothetical protein